MPKNLSGIGSRQEWKKWSCRKTDLPTELPNAPSVRLYLMSTLAGAMEPCGCRKDMLGGIDHAAALLAADAATAPRRLVLAAGPLFFQEPELAAERPELSAGGAGG